MGVGTYVEKVITGHAWLTGDTSGNDDNVGVFEGLAKTTVSGEVASDNGGSVDMREIGSDTDGVDAVEWAYQRLVHQQEDRRVSGQRLDVSNIVL